jgi:D-beta-D-heptose 7-phosphate kinase / D-beta-D-heptose 1-phosphate adenosyltransferase
MPLDLSRLQNATVLVVGDVMLDRYFWGEVGRISPEAPVPVLHIADKTAVLGGAGNVAANLAGLGCTVHLMGVLGDDDAGREVTEKMARAGIQSLLLANGSRPTITKTRLMAQNQQLLRIDEESPGPPSPELLAASLRRFHDLLPAAGAVILSDYGKGMLTGKICQKFIKPCRDRGVPVLVDPKGRDWSGYAGASCITPNTAELRLLSGRPLKEEGILYAVAAQARKKYGLEWLLLTRGARGIALFGQENQPLVIPSRAREVFDVSGAGDTVIATLAAGLAAGYGWEASARLANNAAGIVVRKLGTQPVYQDELFRELQYPELESSRKIFSLEDAQAQVAAWKLAGQKIVFTNGCFDLLHVGHIKLLHGAAARGDKLVVGLNSDASVTRLKGSGRPILAQGERATILSALECVHMVIIFEEDTPLKLIEALRPHTLVKGADYRKDTVVGHELLKEWGGQVVLVDLVEGMSTSGIVELVSGEHQPPKKASKSEIPS